VRVRLLVPLAALAVLLGACSTVPGDAVATVNGADVDYDRFERIVAAQAEGLGLSARDAATAQAAIDAGLVDRAALDAALIAELQLLQQGQESRVDPGPPLEVDDDLVDELYEQQAGATDPAQLSDLGLTERRFREVFERLVRFEARGLRLNNLQTGFPIDRTSQLAGLQQSVIQQLVQAEIARQAVDELDLEIDEDTITEIDEQVRSSFPDQDALDAALAAAGFTQEDYDELVVMTQARQRAIQRIEDPAPAQAFFDTLEVDVASRFGSWDTQQGQVLPPADPA
jgi:hypothetical protein